jgi:predicted transcriptional regulator
MRTTLSLDEDVAAAVERLRRTRRQSLKAIVNEALREGLKQMATAHRKPPEFRTRAVDLGRCLAGAVDDVADVLAIAEGESFR